MIYQDLRPTKKIIIEYIEATWPDEITHPLRDKKYQVKIEKLLFLCTPLNLDQDKLENLLRHQISTGNQQGAVRLIKGLRDRKFNILGYLLISPITVPINIFLALCKAPTKLLRWIIRNS